MRKGSDEENDAAAISDTTRLSWEAIMATTAEH